MDTKSKIFFGILSGLILGSVAFSYYKFVIVRDYFITAQAQCDPASEACFTHYCDPETEEECTGNQEEDTSYYKLIRRNASYMPVCSPSEEGCEALVCPDGEPGCEMTLCDETTLPDAAENAPCNDPTAYILDHPVEEEEEGMSETEGESREGGIGTETTGDEIGAAETSEGTEGEAGTVPESAPDTEIAPVPEAEPLTTPVAQ